MVVKHLHPEGSISIRVRHFICGLTKTQRCSLQKIRNVNACHAFVYYAGSELELETIEKFVRLHPFKMGIEKNLCWHIDYKEQKPQIKSVAVFINISFKRNFPKMKEQWIITIMLVEIRLFAFSP
jgi:Uri superfamily endonuclease